MAHKITRFKSLNASLRVYHIKLGLVILQFCKLVVSIYPTQTVKLGRSRPI